MKTGPQVLLYVLVASVAAVAAAQTPSKDAVGAGGSTQDSYKGGDAAGGKTGIVTPSMRPPGATPKIENLPQTPTQSAGDGSVRNANLPAVLTYTALLKPVAGGPPARLGGWSCSGDNCVLKTTGEMSRARSIEACKGFLQVMKEKGFRASIVKFKANTTTLSEADLRSCRT